jgi:hypothetical protein
MKQNPPKDTHLNGHETELQRYGTAVNRPLSLDHKVRLEAHQH